MRGNPGKSSLERRLDFVIRWGLVLLVFLAPLPFGSVEVWAFSVLEISIAAVALLWLYRLFLFPSTPIAGSVLLLPACGFLALMAFQLVPLPPGFLRAVSPGTATLYASALPGYAAETRVIALAEATLAGEPPPPDEEWRPISQVPQATRTYLFKGVGFTLFFFLILNVFREEGHVRRLLIVFAVTGTIQAFYGLTEYLSGHQHIFAYRKKYYTDAATGTFINRNHFALFLEMSLLVTLGLLFSRLRRRESGFTWRERLLSLNERGTSLNLTLALAVVLLSVALVLSYSRAGIIFGLSAAGLFCLVQVRREWSARKLVIVALLAVAVLAPAYGIGYWTLTGRYAILTEDVTVPGGRITVWEKTLDIFRDFPLLGTGIGTFQHVFPRYRPASVRAFYDYSHNDYLQVLSESGLAGGVLILWGLFLTVWLCLRRAAAGAPAGVLRAAAGFGLLAAGLHEMVDFGLQIPANFLAMTLLVGCLALTAVPRAAGGEQAESAYV